MEIHFLKDFNLEDALKNTKVVWKSEVSKRNRSPNSGVAIVESCSIRIESHMTPNDINSIRPSDR